MQERWTDIEHETIVRGLGAGMSAQEIAKALGHRRRAVVRRIRAYQLDRLQQEVGGEREQQNWTR